MNKNQEKQVAMEYMSPCCNVVSTTMYEVLCTSGSTTEDWKQGEEWNIFN